MFANVTSNVNYENRNILRLAASVETCHLETKWILLLDFIIGIILGGRGGVAFVNNISNYWWRHDTFPNGRRELV